VNLRTLFKRLGPAGPLALAAAVFPLVGSVLLYAYLPTTASWLRDHGLQGYAVYVVGFIVLAGLALMPTYIQAALGGYAFGLAMGAPLAVGGFLGASWQGYEIARTASRERVVKVIDEDPKWRAVKEAFLGSTPGFWRSVGLVTLLRLPMTPFAAINLLLASVRVPRLPYLLGTLVGMAPRTVLAVVVGSGIHDTFNKETLAKAGPPWALWAGIVVTGVIVLYLGQVGNRAIERVVKAQESGGQPPDPKA